jgi:hypothetical protein
VISRQAEIVAQYFHYAYEEAARREGWETQERSRVAWRDLPEANRRTMVDTVQRVAALGVIQLGPALSDGATPPDRPWPNAYRLAQLHDPD